MIIKKPYAFLIKHFKLIHIILFVIGTFLLLRNSMITGFIKEFVTYGVYDSMNDPISKYIPIYLFVILFVICILNTITVLLLKYKEKPWKLYLVPTITYLGLMIMYFLLILYFTGYDGILERTQIRLYKDLLSLLTIAQIPSILIYLMRCLGLDLKKFNFQADQEYLELDEKDQMELEININVDKASIKRVFRKVKRHLGYFVEEHKRLVMVSIAIVVLIAGFNFYRQTFIINKAYSQKDVYKASVYTMKINNVYYTDKDKSGHVISNSSAFVIVELNITNNYFEPVKVRTDYFHLYNGIEQYTDSSNQNSIYFNDLGSTYTQQTRLGKHKSMDILLIYKVNKKLDKDRFVLFYQEKENGNSFLRKIKIKVNDISKIKDNDTLKLGQEIKVPLPGGKEFENLAPDGFAIKDSAPYIVSNCIAEECEREKHNLKAPAGSKIVVISFMTEEFGSKDIIDFSTKYGTINYIDSNNKTHAVKMENATKANYLGQYAYVEVPEEIEQANTINLVYTIRNNRYTYKVKG